MKDRKRSVLPATCWSKSSRTTTGSATTRVWRAEPSARARISRTTTPGPGLDGGAVGRAAQLLLPPGGV